MNAHEAKRNDPTVALVRSSRADAGQITDAEVRELVRDVVRLAGGLEGIVRDGHTVVLKPNLVMTRAVTGSIRPLMMPFDNPYRERVQVPELVNGITTDRRVTRAMVELVRELNPSGRVLIMECSGDGPTSESFTRLGYTHENIPGVDAFVAIGEDGAYREVDADDLVSVEVPNRQYADLPKFLNGRYYFDKTYFEADAIISLCCVKNHMNAAVTGGIKNVGLGARPACIYSPKKKTVSAFVIGHGWEPINAFIHDYYSARPVDFVLSDGLQGLSYGPGGQGAPSYDAAKMNMRLLLASKDAVACDTVQSCIVGVDPERVPYLRDLAAEGFGTIDTSRISVEGNVRVDEVKKPFPLPKGALGRILSSGSKRTLYEDFGAPKLEVDDGRLDDGHLTATVSVEPKVTRLEFLLDGETVGALRSGFASPRIRLDSPPSPGPHTVTVRAFDRFLNGAVRHVEVEA